MRIPFFFGAGLLLFLLQVTVFQLQPEWIGVPDLIYIIIVFMAIHLSTVQGAVLSLVFGIFMDVASGYFLGTYPIAYLLVFFIVRGMSFGLSINDSTHQPPIIALGYLLGNGVVYVFSAMLSDEALAPWSWGHVLQRVLIVTVLAMPVNKILNVLLRYCDRKVEKRSFLRRRGIRGQGNRYKDQKI